MFRPPAGPNSDSKVIFPDQWNGRAATPGPELPTVQNSVKEKVQFIEIDNADSQLPAFPPATPPRPPLVPERSDFLEGDAPAADKVQAFLARALEAGDGSATVAGALVPWICDALRRTTRSKPMAATSWISSAICRPRG